MPLEGIFGGQGPKGLTSSSFGELLAARTKLVNYLFTHHVVVVRGLGELKAEQLVLLASLFGRPEVTIATAHHLDQYPCVEVVRRTGGEPGPRTRRRPGVRTPRSFFWHSDRSFLPTPSLATIAYLRETPKAGGELQFINVDRTVRMLSSEQWRMLNRLEGLHSFARYWVQLAGVECPDAEIAGAMRLYPDVTHPIMAPHPATGRMLPYISPLTLKHTLGRRVEAVLSLLLSTDTGDFASIAPRTHDLVFWDNYGALHRETRSVGASEMWRITVATP
jgi:alpha-ketoglutarate-dependent taurine dioxygenase